MRCRLTRFRITPSNFKNNRILFFFQAEDGIRDSSVTGVQTCALPIWGKSDAEKAAEQQAKQIEAAYKKNLEATRKLQDAQLQLETDEWAKRRQQTQYQ